MVRLAHGHELKLLTLILLVVFTNQSMWINITRLPVSSRSMVGFSIGGKGYVIHGTKGTWEYDPPRDTWTRVAYYPKKQTTGLVAFTIGNRAYVGTGKFGTESNYTILNDMYKYNPANDMWSQIKELPRPIESAIAFSVNGKGYVGTGDYSTNNTFNNATGDMWEYNPLINVWKKIADYPIVVEDAVAFSINGKGYVGTGNAQVTTSRFKSFWEYNPLNDSWTSIADFPTESEDAVAFSVGSKGYVGTGDTGSPVNDMWEYNPRNNSWTPVAGVRGPARQDAVSFSVGCVGYVGTGKDVPGGVLSDFWKIEFPDCLCSMPAPVITPAPVCVLGKWTVNGSVYVTGTLDMRNTAIVVLGFLTMDGVVKVDGDSVVNVTGCIEFNGILEIDVQTLDLSEPFVPLLYSCISNSSIVIVLTGQGQCQEITYDGDYIQRTSLQLVFTERDICQDEGGDAKKTYLVLGIVGGIIFVCVVCALIGVCVPCVRRKLTPFRVLAARRRAGLEMESA